MTVTPLFGILVWLPFPFLGFQYGFPPPFWDFSLFSGLQYGYRLSSPISGFEDCTPKWLPQPFLRGFQHGCHSPFGSLIWPPSPFFGISKWLSSPCSGFQCACNWLSRDFHHGYHTLFSGFRNNCHPSFRNSSMAAMSLFGIPIWLPSTILVFAHGYISLFRDLKIVTIPFSGIRRKRKTLTRLTPWETHTIRIHCPPVGVR